MQGSRDAYLVLQLHPTAAPEVVEAAYRALALLTHPDRNGGNGGEDAMAELNWAYQLLRDPIQRAAYDRSRVAIPIEQPRGTLRDRMQRRAAETQDSSASAQVVLDFGRYAGMTLGQLARSDPGYLQWLRRQTVALRMRRQIDEVLQVAAHNG